MAAFQIPVDHRSEVHSDDIDHLVQDEPVIPHEGFDIAEQGLPAIDLDELDLGLDDHGIGELLHTVLHHHQFRTLA